MLRALTYSESIFNEIIMIILDVRIGYELCGLDCQRKEKKNKNLQVLWDVFLMFWTLWGLRRDTAKRTGRLSRCQDPPLNPPLPRPLLALLPLNTWVTLCSNPEHPEGNAFKSESFSEDPWRQLFFPNGWVFGNY